MSREESELLWKIDIRVIPLFALLYTFSFMDKVNIGNAKLENLEEDLHLTENQYNMILASFFIAYVLFEVPSNIMLMNSRPSVWIPSIMLACGIILICTAAAQNFPQIMILRFLLGTFEAGFFPGAVFYITKWYKNNEENFRISLFVSAATIAGAFSGLMSFSISTFFHEANGLGGWQWAFIIDGTLTCAVALFSYFLIPDSPETASWLTRRERKLAIERLSHEPSHHHKDYTEKHQILEAFKDWKIYMAMLLYFCILAPLYSFSFFISSIVKGLGFDALYSQLLAAPPFILGSGASLVVAIASDRAGVRGPYLICCLLVAIMGYAFLITQNVSIPVKYLGACIIGIGLFPCVPTSITWLINNLAGETKCAIGDALMIAAGNIGAGISTQFYKSLDAPDYKFSNSISLALLVVAIIIVLININLLSRANDKKLIEQYYRDINDEETTMKFGEKHPTFMYSL
ncbi:major facilitator superfamily domain-containing protein [Gigaspora rosea]|uniref:Major facilitator superfamily domain-containing protein n=1 Tax=Gigaspora rosea TaxID=44941 RepID=A0A397VGJ2_9GLOM|nr:major facilitator superfamily domain-containing protein [Gigaspora rosea]